MLLLITLSPRLTLAMVLLLRTLGLLIPRLSSRMTALLRFRLIHPLVRLTMLLQMTMCLMTLLSITLNLLLTQITLLAAVLLLLYNIRTMNRLSQNPMIRIHLLAMSAALRMLALLMWMLRPWMVTLLQWKLRHLQVTLIERSILMTKRQAMLALTMLNLLLTLAALTGCGGDSAKAVTSNGVECYRVDGVCYPAVFGEPQLTGEEITALLDGGDTAEMAATVSTVPDALRLLKARQQDSEDIDSQDVETTLLRGSSQPRGWVDALLYLLAGDYEESGRIDLYSSSNYCAYAAIAQDGLYYAFDPFEIRGDCWLVLSGENYVNADAQKLADTLRTRCGFSTSAYTANAYPVLSKEEQEQRKAFEQREYTDEEIQALADSGISFAEACEKISTVADAAQFLEARGYSFAPDDAGTGAALRYQLNSGACVGTSALFGALLNGDYDEVGYVYVFWLESEHVFNYVKQDGVYYACDFVYGPVTQSGTDARRSSIRYSGESLSGLFDAYAQQEGSDIGNAVAIMYTTAYCGDPTMPAVWLRDSADGHQSTIHLSDAEKDTQQILLLRDGYTFTF